KFVERREEMVVAGLVVREEIMHRERGDKRVVEVAVVQRRRRRHHLVAARRLGQSEAPAVDAQTVGRRPFKKALGIDRAGQMVVQVGALGEGPQEGFELNLVGTDRVETVPYLLGVARRRTISPPPSMASPGL